MKRQLLSISLILLACIPVWGQPFPIKSTVQTAATTALQAVPDAMIPGNSAPTPLGRHIPAHAKMTGAAFYTQSFPSLPAGWSVSALTGSVNGWRWANAAPTGPGNNFPINGLINSTSRGNGWLLYNADSVLTTAGATRPVGGSITSSPIPVGASHSQVMLSFQQYFRYSTGDSCFVDVSKDGVAWTAYPVHPNMTLTQFGFLYSDPTVVTINISSVVGGQANAYIRFRFVSTAATYSFNWLIDDLILYDADATDLGMAHSGIASASEPTAGFSSSYSYSSIPLQFADTVFPITYLSNYGLSAGSNTQITARYFLGNTLLSTQTMTAASIPLESRDSAVVFNTGYKPLSAGNYVVALSMSPTGDAVPGNNTDTIRFSVTDSAYAPYGSRFTERNCFLNRPSTATIQYWGSRFSISNGQNDTITSVSAAFRPETIAGERVQAQLYQASGSGATFNWLPLASSGVRGLTAAEISTPGNLVMTTFPLRAFGGNFAPLILEDGDYAIVLTTVNATKDVAVYSMVPPLPTAPAFIGYQGQSDISPNDGSFAFAGGGGIATGLVQVPLVHPNFGNSRSLLGVSEQKEIVLGAAFPNPARNSFQVTIGLRQSGEAALLLRNALGQAVDRIDLGHSPAGMLRVARVNTAHLPSGMYFYTVQSADGVASGSIVVSH